MDIIDKAERKFGEWGAIFFAFVIGLCLATLFGFWVASCVIFVWPLVLPFVIAAVMYRKLVVKSKESE